MKLIALSLAGVALAFVAVACTQNAAPTNSQAPVGAASPSKPTDEFAAARVTYQTNCESCHGPTGDGGPVKVEGKEIKVPSLKNERIVKRTDERIIKVINEGDGPMPPFKDKIKPEEIAALVRFVRKEFHGK
jgi:mono/diheme cytochrome c family protein